MLRRFAEYLLAGFAPAELVRILDRMAGFMTENAQAPFHRSTLDFQHLGLFQLCQAGMGEIERYGNTGHDDGSKPLIREPEVWAKQQTTIF